MITLYGIPNCDTVKKARKWLDAEAVDYTFHDFRADGLELPLLQSWLKTHALLDIVNRRSATWRQLSDAQKALLGKGEGLDILLAQPTLIKRPVLEKDGAVVSIGFKEADYRALFK